MDARDAYRQLRARVDDFERASVERGAELSCRRGCEACCHVDLEVSAIEASFVAEAIEELELSQRLARDDDRCVMLGDEGACAIYADRPLVCRSQGLALAYPPDVVPVEAVFAKMGDQELTWCPLNFRQAPPTAPDVMDAGRLDEALATLNRAFVGEGDSLRRFSLRELVRARADADGR